MTASTAEPSGGDIPFGEMSALLAPRSVAVVGASDREGNLGGVAVGFLKKFAFHGPVWPVNPGRKLVAGLPCYPSLRELPSPPDLAILAVAAESVAEAARECAAAGVPAAVAWAGGFAELGEEGRARQRQLEDACRAGGVKLCGPNCIGIINTAIGLTASFSSMLYDCDRLTPGAVSVVSQSGGIAVMAHSRAQQLGLGFRVTVSCGNEAVLGIPDFVSALARDAGTRVIAVYLESLSSPTLVDALAAARAAGKPVVVLKGGGSEASNRAALAHTGRLAGIDRTYDAIFRELAAIRVYSVEELLDVSLQLASLEANQLPAGNRVLVSTFGGGNGVICTDQCAREGLSVPQLDADTMREVVPLLTPISSALNPIDFTPAMMTSPQYRANMPQVLQVLAGAPSHDAWVFLTAGLGSLAPEMVEMYDRLRSSSAKPILLAWQSPPEGITEALAARGICTYPETARAVRTAGYLARYAADLKHRIRRCAGDALAFAWGDHVNGQARGVISEHAVARILEAAGLPVAPGRLAASTGEAVGAAEALGFPVAIKAISAAVTHRAEAGLVALNLGDAQAVAAADRALRSRAAELGVTLEGIWVQRMFAGDRELLVTAFRDREFGVMVGCGMGGGMTELIDDVALARAPIAPDGALDLLARLRTLRRLPALLSERQRTQAAAFVARFSALAASAPWQQFTLEVNPLKLGRDGVAAVDGLLIIE
ncbi:MAG: acetate--CoA ligase family protein [Burkholderiales bacterium]|nr:acetate--CoA ligase family protein [Burkholderiales bacterium]